MKTVGDLKKYLVKHNIADSAKLCVYVGGPDAHDWVVNKLSCGEGIIVKDINGKGSVPCIFGTENYDDEELDGRKSISYVKLGIYS